MSENLPTTETEFDTNLNRLDSLLQGLNVSKGVGADEIQEGVFGSNSDTTGIEFGTSPSAKISFIQSKNFVSGTSGWQILSDGTVEFSSGTFRGALAVGTNGLHVDTSGNMWWGSSTTYAGATIKISSAGSVNFTTGTFSGTISGATITGGNIDIFAGVIHFLTIDTNGITYLRTGSSTASWIQLQTSGAMTLSGVGDSSFSTFISLSSIKDEGVASFSRNNATGSGSILYVSGGVNEDNSAVSNFLTAGSNRASDLMTVSAPHLYLNPIASASNNVIEGCIYADTDHHLYYYNGTGWIQLDN